MHRLTQQYQDIPQGYTVVPHSINDQTTTVKVILNGTLQTRDIPSNLLEEFTPSKPKPNTYTRPLTNEPNWSEPGTPNTIKVTCTCGKMSRYISAAYVKAWANENAAINYVKASCPVCNPYIGAAN